MSLILREMQIITSMRYHLTPVKMAIINKSTNNSVGKDVEKREPKCTVGGNAVWCSLCEEQYGVFLKIKKRELLFDPVIPLLEMYPEDSKMPIQKIYVPQCLSDCNLQ